MTTEHESKMSPETEKALIEQCEAFAELHRETIDLALEQIEVTKQAVKQGVGNALVLESLLRLGRDLEKARAATAKAYGQVEGD